MDLKVLAVILIYYMCLSSFFLFGAEYLGDSTFTSELNTSSELGAGELDTGGLFGTGISFGRFVGLITIGVGLPDGTPSFFAILFMIIQSCITIFSIGFVISSVWNG